MHTNCMYMNFKNLHNRTIYLLGGGNVLASTNVSDRNADQPIFDDITNMLRADWLNIWDSLTADQRNELINRDPANPISRNGWITEQIPFFRVMLEVLSCRVVSKDVSLVIQPPKTCVLGGWITRLVKMYMYACIIYNEVAIVPAAGRLSGSPISGEA